MAGKLLERKKNIAVEIESTEGTAETLVDADATMLVYDSSYTPNIGRFQRNPARSTLSQLAGITGMQAAAIGWKAELKGSGSIATAPAWNDAILACGFDVSVVSTVAIGAITGGPFLPCETITGAGGGTGRVVGEIATGASVVHYVPIASTIGSSELITGGTSGATATTSGAPATAKGFEYRPISDDAESATVGLYEDGLKKMIHGARGNVGIESAVGQPMFLAFEFSGVYNAEIDAAMLSPTYESTLPIAFLNVGATVGGDSTPCFVDMNIDMGNEVVERQCANNAAGIISYMITGRTPMATLNPEKKLVADNDIYAAMIANTEGRLYVELPGSAGEKITIGAPRTVYGGIAESERNGLKVADLTLELIAGSVSTGDDELQIGVI